MNKDRREKLRGYRRLLVQAQTGIDAVREEEDIARENVPENLAYSERYEESEEYSEALDSAVGLIGQAIESIDTVI